MLSLFFSCTDVNVATPDKKSVMMYVMCYFQVLPHSNIVIEDLDLSPTTKSPPQRASFTPTAATATAAHKPHTSEPPVPLTEVGVSLESVDSIYIVDIG